jgi:hypothetical protein
MNPTAEAWLLSWSFDPWVIVPLFLAGVIYVRGWRELRCGGRPAGGVTTWRRSWAGWWRWRWP